MPNTAAMRRGWHWDAANSTLDLYVAGTEVATFSTTTTTLIGIQNIGSNASPKTYTEGTPAVAWYFTCANTSSTNAEPFYVKSVMTGASGYGGRCRFHAYTNAALQTNFMAIKAHTEFGASGSCAGLATALCAELAMPNANVGGSYYCLELEYVAGGTTTQASSRGWIYANSTGDADGDFDDNGVLMKLDGLTVGSGHLFQVNTAAAASHALKINIGTTAYYIMLTDTGA